MIMENVVIGTPYDNLGANNAGTAYLFDANDQSVLKPLQNISPANGDLFGRAVAASEDYVVVGAPFDDSAEVDAGRAYLFHASNASLARVFQSPVPEAGEYFGWSVSLANHRILITPPEAMLAESTREQHTCLMQPPVRFSTHFGRLSLRQGTTLAGPRLGHRQAF
jgi:hypothetical protein